MTQPTPEPAAGTAAVPAADGPETAAPAPEPTDLPPAALEAASGQPQPESEADTTQPDTFPRAYVEQLRKENGERRIAATEATRRADDLAHRLHTELVRATGRLADPSDLEFNAEHLEDAGKLTAAVDALLARRPHLASRRPQGSIGQGEIGGTADVDLAGLLRSRA